MPDTDSEHAGEVAGGVFNILIDPGQGVIDNLYRVGLAVADVDMIIATHDHPDHLAAFDAILSLRHERREAEEHRHVIVRETKQSTEYERMLILGNSSVVSRYSFLNGKGEYVVQHIDDASAQRCPQLERRKLRVRSLPTRHLDLGGDNAVGFVLTFKPLAASITFMSDTAIEGLGQYKNCRVKPDKTWGDALKSDIVVAHVSDAPSGELRELARLGPTQAVDGVDRFEKSIAKLREKGRTDEAVRLIQALSLTDDQQLPQGFKMFGSGFVKSMKTWQHLYLHGLLAVSQEMAGVHDSTKRVLVVGELREQLGSLRGTIAREINRHVFRRSRDAGLPVTGGTESHIARPVALTADIGLRIRITARDDAEGPRVYCSTCALDNDHLIHERYHRPEDIREVCVKGDHEAMYWNCRRHDPSGRRGFPVFVEQMSSYDPLAAGGRFHG